jgi:hypothetical protein
MFCVFIGLDGSPEENKIHGTNYWLVSYNTFSAYIIFSNVIVWMSSIHLGTIKTPWLATKTL